MFSSTRICILGTLKETLSHYSYKKIQVFTHILAAFFPQPRINMGPGHMLPSTVMHTDVGTYLHYVHLLGDSSMVWAGLKCVYHNEAL